MGKTGMKQEPKTQQNFLNCLQAGMKEEDRTPPELTYIKKKKYMSISQPFPEEARKAEVSLLQQITKRADHPMRSYSEVAFSSVR